MKNYNNNNINRQYLLFSERTAVVQLLLSKKVNPNTLNSKGETALFIAVEEDFPEIVQVLLEGGADPTIKCNSSLSKKGTCSIMKHMIDHHTHIKFECIILIVVWIGPITPAQLNKLKKGNKEIGKMLKKAEKDGCNIQ